jgi:hypothetical protein
MNSESEAQKHAAAPHAIVLPILIRKIANLLSFTMDYYYLHYVRSNNFSSKAEYEEILTTVCYHC